MDKYLAGLIVGTWMKSGLGAQDIVLVGGNPARYAVWLQGVAVDPAVLLVVNNVFGENSIASKIFFLRLIAKLQEMVENPPSPYENWEDLASAVAFVMVKVLPAAVGLIP